MKLGLLGDTMLGRGVATKLHEEGPTGLFDDGVVGVLAEADLVVANLECCISSRGEPADKRFVFRAPPVATEALVQLGVDVVTLANNHSLDFGVDALTDTLTSLDHAGIAQIGAGLDEGEARRAHVAEVGELRIGLVSFTDHPREFAAGPHRPGVAFVDLRHLDVPRWLRERIGSLPAGVVVVLPHWGPNMVTEPVPWVRRAATQLGRAGASLIAGHSAHLFHGVSGTIIYDLGDFIDDYRRDPELRNDLSVIAMVEIDDRGPASMEMVPIRIGSAHTQLATGADAEWVVRRFRSACARLGTTIVEQDGRAVVDLR
jgi:poly-gamma-glutamate synthesis protein (capsule biosynthesis protein)